MKIKNFSKVLKDNLDTWYKHIASIFLSDILHYFKHIKIWGPGLDMQTCSTVKWRYSKTLIPSLQCLQWKWFTKLVHGFLSQISAYNKGSASRSWLRWMKCRLLNCSRLFYAETLLRSVEQSLLSHSDGLDLVCAL